MILSSGNNSLTNPLEDFKGSYKCSRKINIYDIALYNNVGDASNMLP